MQAEISDLAKNSSSLFLNLEVGTWDSREEERGHRKQCEEIREIESNRSFWQGVEDDVTANHCKFLFYIHPQLLSPCGFCTYNPGCERGEHNNDWPII